RIIASLLHLIQNNFKKIKYFLHQNKGSWCVIFKHNNNSNNNNNNNNNNKGSWFSLFNSIL
ncbi:MAG: hypothetical protein N7Q72_03960, partial [Spiroplasma sp. Tabriz.8]|nr:hypothetical protein [Spiroplasma sp. Tabriz.8]